MSLALSLWRTTYREKKLSLVHYTSKDITFLLWPFIFFALFSVCVSCVCLYVMLRYQNMHLLFLWLFYQWIFSEALFQKLTFLKQMFIGINDAPDSHINIKLAWLHLSVVVLCPLLSAVVFGKQFRCVTCIPGGRCFHGNTLTVGHMLLSWNFIGCVTKINECCFKR